MPPDNDNPAAMPSFEINRLVRELLARVAALEAERDALLRHCTVEGDPPWDDKWYAMVHPLGVSEWERFDTEAECHAAIRKAAGFGDGGEV